MELIGQLSDGAKLGILYLGTLSPSTPSFIWSKIGASAPATPHLMPSFKGTIQMLHLALLLVSHWLEISHEATHSCKSIWEM